MNALLQLSSKKKLTMSLRRRFQRETELKNTRSANSLRMKTILVTVPMKVYKNSIQRRMFLNMETQLTGWMNATMIWMTSLILHSNQLQGGLRIKTQETATMNLSPTEMICTNQKNRWKCTFIKILRVNRVKVH